MKLWVLVLVAALLAIATCVRAQDQPQWNVWVDQANGRVVMAIGEFVDLVRFHNSVVEERDRLKKGCI